LKKEDNHYFDKIDTKQKAYWIGFLWSDGYCSIRQRKNKNGIDTYYEYLLKLDLSDKDVHHVEKLRDELDKDIKIKLYPKYSGFLSNSGVCRFSIYNKHLVCTLQNEYGIFPKRTDCKKMISKIQKEYYRDFIRGIFDADGSFTYYVLRDKNNYKKINVRFGATIELLDFIQNVSIENNISTECFKKYSKRHPRRDGEYYQLAYSGTVQGEKILTWLYKDADIYLDRKYQKWIDKWKTE
jgi:intein-encoded DNA endonuclease-like protein